MRHVNTKGEQEPLCREDSVLYSRKGWHTSLTGEGHEDLAAEASTWSAWGREALSRGDV